MRSRTAAKVFLGALWVVCAYRAVTQSIVHDEALTYQLYLTGPFSQIFQLFSANHHFLNTLLMYGCVSLLGLSEWSLRLPALAGAALYFAAVYRLSAHVFGTGYTFLLAIGLLTLNPFILDFMLAARGYGMALGLWMWALAPLLSYIDEPKARTPRKLVEAAIALALAVVANLVFAFPAVVLAIAAVWMLRKRSPAPLKKKGRKAAAEEPSVPIYFVAPIVAVAVVFLIASPLESASSEKFYAGAATIQESLRSLADVSLAYGGPLRQSRFGAWTRDAAAFVLAPAILLAGLAVGVIRRNRLLLLCSAAAIGSALLLVLSHLALGMPYPLNRTGIYFPPLVALALLGLASGAPRKEAAIAAYLLSGTLLLAFALQWNVRKFVVWEYDADTREIANRLSATVLEKRPNSVRVGSSWQLEPSLNFYRDKNHWTWMQPVTRAPLNQEFDYYVVAPVDRSVIDSLGLKLLYQGPVSGTALAARR